MVSSSTLARVMMGLIRGLSSSSSRLNQRGTATERNQGAVKAQSKGTATEAQSMRNQRTTTHLLEDVLWLEALGDHELCEVAHDLG